MINSQSQDSSKKKSMTIDWIRKLIIINSFKIVFFFRKLFNYKLFHSSDNIKPMPEEKYRDVESDEIFSQYMYIRLLQNEEDALQDLGSDLFELIPIPWKVKAKGMKIQTGMRRDSE